MSVKTYSKPRMILIPKFQRVLSCFNSPFTTFSRSKPCLFISFQQAGPFVHLKSSFAVSLKADKGSKSKYARWWCLSYQQTPTDAVNNRCVLLGISAQKCRESKRHHQHLVLFCLIAMEISPISWWPTNSSAISRAWCGVGDLFFTLCLLIGTRINQPLVCFHAQQALGRGRRVQCCILIRVWK